jgi:hypothetical protein
MTTGRLQCLLKNFLIQKHARDRGNRWRLYHKLRKNQRSDDGTVLDQRKSKGSNREKSNRLVSRKEETGSMDQRRKNDAAAAERKAVTPEPLEPPDPPKTLGTPETRRIVQVKV